MNALLRRIAARQSAFASSLFCWGIFHLTYSLKIIGPAILVALALGMAIYNRIRMTRNDAKNALNSNKE
jgi:PTS system galactitol-specific IIC component